jgi:hypothetical protein
MSKGQMYPSNGMKVTLALRTGWGILFGAACVWATEPSVGAVQRESGNDAARLGSLEVTTPLPASATHLPVQDAAMSDRSVTAAPGGVPSSGPVGAQELTPATPTPVSPVNSVAASPYDVASSEPATAAQAVASPQSDDAPATLLDSSFYALGGFAGLGVMYTRFAGGDRPLICGEAAVIIDHAFTFGGGGCGIPDSMNAASVGVSNTTAEDRVQFGYGGAIARYHIFSRRVTNLAVGVLIGAGGVVVGKWIGSSEKPENFDVKNQDAVFIVEPQIGGFANLTRWLRVGAIAGYRVASGVDLKGINASDVRGLTLGGQIQGGWF